MKSIFSFFRSSKKSDDGKREDAAQAAPAPEQDVPLPEATVDGAAEPTAQDSAHASGAPEASSAEASEEDGFCEWLRTATRGGIEPNGRNDIYEAYSVYGVVDDGRIVRRYYHRYPEYDRGFDLSGEHSLTFDQLNRELLEELDRGGITLERYCDAIAAAERLLPEHSAPGSDAVAFSAEEIAVLTDFCDALDTLKDKQYLTKGGVFLCTGVSVVGDEELWLRFRKPLRHDAFYGETFGVKRTEIGGYDIENLWIMSVYNRLYQISERCRVIMLASEWNLSAAPVTLIAAEGTRGIDGTLLVTVAGAETLARFGTYSLNFLRR